MPQKGAYRIARMLKKLEPDAQPILEAYDKMITAYNHKVEMKDADGVVFATSPSFSVPDDKMPEFLANWKTAVGDQEHTIDVEPIPLEQIDNGTAAGAISSGELLALGDLVRE